VVGVNSPDVWPGAARTRATTLLRGGQPMLAAVAISILVGYLVAGPSLRGVPLSPVLVAAGIAVIPLGLVVLKHPGASFLAAVALVIVVPHKAPHVWLVPPLLIGLGVLVERLGWRPTNADLWFAGWFGWLLVRWLAHPGLQVGAKEFAQMALALGFYLFARMAVTPSRMSSTLWWVLGAGTVGAATVLVELMLGHVIGAFNDPAQYQWSGGGGELYRPGGVFGGSPAAAIALAMILLSTLSLARRRPWLVRVCHSVILLAIVVTWARAGWIGLAGGAVVCALLLPYRRKAWAMYLLAALVLAGFLAYGSMQNSQAYQSGVVRPGSTTARLTLLRQAWPLATDSYRHAIFGRGFRAFMHPEFGAHDRATLGNGFLLNRGGPHNDYMRTILEEGLVGLVLLLGFLLIPVRLGVRRARSLLAGSEERLLVAGLTGAAVCYALVGFFHDLSNNVQDLTVGALILGLLVTSTQRRSRSDGEHA
jgi:O-antigen ligase